MQGHVAACRAIIEACSTITASYTGMPVHWLSVACEAVLCVDYIYLSISISEKIAFRSYVDCM
jgi:hypothetical protein